MSMTDPVADLLTRIRNGCLAKSDAIQVPASRLKANVVKVLRDEGFVRSFKLTKEDSGRAWINIQLKYDSKGTSVIRGIRRVSRPGLRKYVGYAEVSRVRSGSGVAVISTSKGVMTGRNARNSKVGGEYLCEVW